MNLMCQNFHTRLWKFLFRFKDLKYLVLLDLLKGNSLKANEVFENLKLMSTCIKQVKRGCKPLAEVESFCPSFGR